MVGGGCSVMLSADGLYVFDVPRSIFDDLPGVEVDRIDGQTNHRFWYKCGTFTGGMDSTFFCKEPLSSIRETDEACPARSDQEPYSKSLGGNLGCWSERTG